MRDTMRISPLFALTLLLAAATLACKDSSKFTGPDGVDTSGDGIPGPWDEGTSLEAGASAELQVLSSTYGGTFVFDIDWKSSDNDVSFIVYRVETTGNVPYEALCFLPLEDFSSAPPESALPACAEAASNRTREKPKRVKFTAEAPTDEYWLTATNNGPGAEDVRLREIKFR